MWNWNNEQKRDSEPRNYSPPQNCLDAYFLFQSNNILNKRIIANNNNSNNLEIPRLERISESEQNNEIFDINLIDENIINNDIREKKINLEIHKGFRKTLFGIPKQIKDNFDSNKVNRLKDQLRIQEEIISKYQKQLKEKDLLISNFQKTIEKYKYLLEVNDIVDTVTNPQKYSNYEEEPKQKEIKNKIDNNVNNFTVNKKKNLQKIIHSKKNYQKIDKEEKEDNSTLNRLSLLIRDQGKIISQQSNKKKPIYSIINDMNNYEFDDEQYLSKVKQKKEKLNAQEINAMQLPDVDNMSYEELLSLENQIGIVNRGLSKHQIKMLPQITFKNFLNFNNQTNCLICQENFVEQEQLRKFNCGHIFHIECVDQWLENEKTCPTCKKSVI